LAFELQCEMPGRCPQRRSELRVNDEKRIPSSEEQAKARRRKILERLNTMDTGANHHNSEQEQRRAHEIEIARAKERRWGGGGL
jgi:hypothetical protein